MSDLVQRLKKGNIPGSLRWEAARRIEELEAGCCRRNCVKERDTFGSGYTYGVRDGHRDWDPYAAYNEWRQRCASS